MEIDRSKFLRLVALIGATSCAPVQATPASTTPASTAAPTGEGGAPIVEGGAPAVEGSPAVESTAPASEGVAAVVDLAGCDDLMFAPCGEGLPTRSYCASIAKGLDDRQRKVFFACTHRGAASVKVGEKACAEPSHRCAVTSGRCSDASDALDACSRRVHDACADGPEARKETACFRTCLEAAGKAKDVAKAVMACGATCGGEPGTAAKTCARVREAKECSAQTQAATACSTAMSTDCAVAPVCSTSIFTACAQANAVFERCQTEATKR